MDLIYSYLPNEQIKILDYLEMLIIHSQLTGSEFDIRYSRACSCIKSLNKSDQIQDLPEQI